MLVALLLLTAPAGIAALRGVVSFELDNVLWDSNKIRTGVSSELRNFLADRGVEQPLDVYGELERLKEQGSQYGMMQPGAKAIQKECLSIVLAAAGVTEESKDDLLIETLAMWLQLQDTEANRWVAEEAVSALSALKEKGFACCAITSGIGDTTRTPVLAPLVEFTLCTYDFTVPADTMWDVSMQVAPAKIPEAMGLPWVHVGGPTEGGLAALGKQSRIKTIAVGEAGTLEGATPTKAIASLRELVDAVEEMVPES